MSPSHSDLFQVALQQQLDQLMVSISEMQWGTEALEKRQFQLYR